MTSVNTLRFPEVCLRDLGGQRVAVSLSPNEAHAGRPVLMGSRFHGGLSANDSATTLRRHTPASAGPPGCGRKCTASLCAAL